MRTFTAQVGPSNASQLSAVSVDDVNEALMEDIGEGTVRINDLDRLREFGEDEDGRVTEDDEDGLQIWIGGESYPIFDDVEAAVAEAMGLQTRYVDAKQTFDHARDLYAASVASVSRRPARPRRPRRRSASRRPRCSRWCRRSDFRRSDFRRSDFRRASSRPGARVYRRGRGRGRVIRRRPGVRGLPSRLVEMFRDAGAIFGGPSDTNSTQRR